MMKKDITNAKLLSGWTLTLTEGSTLPQDVATAFYDLYEKFGAMYKPVYYVGHQLVNGTNHKIIAERNRLISGGAMIREFAVITINIPIGSVGGKGATKVSENDSTNFILRDEIEKGIKIAIGKENGINYKPILELGTQGKEDVTEYVFICESTIADNAAASYLTCVTISNQNDDWNIVEIERL